MLGRAQLGVYRDLIHVDLVSSSPEKCAYHGINAAMCSSMSATWLRFRSVRRIPRPGGCLAFTVELATSAQDVELLPSLRYAHSEAYIRRLADEAGFTSVNMFEAPIRHDQATPIMGLYVYLE
jgi:predicted TPR repeat methyltransferase